MDLVGTCPKAFWEEWLGEGSCAGGKDSGDEYGWYTRSRSAELIKPGDRFYVVAHGKLRGWAPVTKVVFDPGYPEGGWIICRRGGAVACTIPQPIPGFRGLRKRWWERETEIPFPDWKTP